MYTDNAFIVVPYHAEVYVEINVANAINTCCGTVNSVCLQDEIGICLQDELGDNLINE